MFCFGIRVTLESVCIVWNKIIQFLLSKINQYLWSGIIQGLLSGIVLVKSYEKASFECLC